MYHMRACMRVHVCARVCSVFNISVVSLKDMQYPSIPGCKNVVCAEFHIPSKKCLHKSRQLMDLINLLRYFVCLFKLKHLVEAI